MKIENIQEAIKIAFKDKRIVVVRGGNMSHEIDYVGLEGFKYRRNR
jgi:hypothetical protein